MHKINYREPTTYDKRRRAGFWLGAGGFLASVAVPYIIAVIICGIIGIVAVLKLLSLCC